MAPDRPRKGLFGLCFSNDIDVPLLLPAIHPVGSIIGAESLGAYSVVWLADAAPVVRRSLASLESRLPGEFFIRANRSQLINLQHVQTVEPWFSGGLKIVLNGGRTVELSRRQARIFRERSTL